MAATYQLQSFPCQKRETGHLSLSVPIVIKPEVCASSSKPPCPLKPRIVRPWEDKETNNQPKVNPSNMQTSPRQSPPLPPSPASSPVPSPVHYQSSRINHCVRKAATPEPSQVVIAEHVAFMQEVQRIQMSSAPQNDTWLKSLLTSYLAEVQSLESLRYQALLSRVSDPSYHQTIHRYYDVERLVILRHAQRSLSGYKMTLVPHRTQPSPPATPQLCTSFSSTGSSPGSSPRTPMAFTTASPSCTTSGSVVTGRRMLNRKAVDLLEEWYCFHKEHPYATSAEIQQLAAAGGISTTQARKWLANRRTRSNNTAGYTRGRKLFKDKHYSH